MNPTSVRSAASANWNVWGDYSFGDPAFLTLIPIGLLVLWYGRARRGRLVGSTPVLPGVAMPASLRQRLRPLATLFQVLAFVSTVVALARPLKGNVQVSTESEGVDIALVVDRSGSMKYDDLEVGKSRLDVVKEVVGEFATRRMTDRVGAADNVGLFAYAQYPELVCPFTLDVASLMSWLETIEIVKYREEDGTAIGAALAKAVAVLKESTAKSRIIVLLTDGENNVDDITPMEAAELAAEEGVRVYTIAAGRFRYQQDWMGQITRTEYRIDTTELRRIAELTGGRFYRAQDKDDLESVYEEIEELERTPREERRFEETYDLYPWLLLLAVGLYGSAWFSHSTWARRLP